MACLIGVGIEETETERERRRYTANYILNFNSIYICISICLFFVKFDLNTAKRQLTNHRVNESFRIVEEVATLIEVINLLLQVIIMKFQI